MTDFAAADKLTDDRDVDGALAALLKIEEEQGDAAKSNVELLWRLARASFEVSESKEGDEAKAYADKALAYAEACLVAGPENSLSFKWAAITVARQGDFSDTKKKIGDSYKIKEYADKACELNPEDATVAHLQGRWCFGVANIGFIERKLASVIFDTPPVSTFEAALEYFLRHEELMKGDGSIRNKLYVGQTYEKLSNKEKAKEYYKLAFEKPAATTLEKKLAEEAKKKFDSLNSSWF